MNTVEKALWYIESHLPEILSLEDVAGNVGVTPFHLTRAFSISTGRSLMRYVRSRRLTQAAHALAKGAPNILGTAIDAGYGSHEAFSRAFRDQFGVTPESVRDQRHLKNINLMEPMKMDIPTAAKINPIRMEDGKVLLIAGLNVRYAFEEGAGLPTRAGIPGHWQKFGAYLGRIAGQIGSAAYGVCSNFDSEGTYDYMAGVEVKDFAGHPPELAHLRIPAQRYAVFAHRDHVSSVSGTWDSIMNQWLPKSGVEAVDAPQFEKYSEAFDPRTGLGGLEIWIPILRQ